MDGQIVVSVVIASVMAVSTLGMTSQLRGPLLAHADLEAALVRSVGDMARTGIALPPLPGPLEFGAQAQADGQGLSPFPM